jgi:hypothetical protein
VPELPPRDREHEQGSARSACVEPRPEAVAKGEVLAERLLISDGSPGLHRSEAARTLSVRRLGLHHGAEAAAPLLHIPA